MFTSPSHLFTLWKGLRDSICQKLLPGASKPHRVTPSLAQLSFLCDKISWQRLNGKLAVLYGSSITEDPSVSCASHLHPTLSQHSLAGHQACRASSWFQECHFQREGILANKCSMLMSNIPKLRNYLAYTYFYFRR